MDDVHTVKEMAHNPGAWNNPDALVMYVWLPPPKMHLNGGLTKGAPNPHFGKEEADTVLLIRQALAQGCCVVVYPHWKFPADGFDLESLEKLCGPLSQLIDWQGDVYPHGRWVTGC